MEWATVENQVETSAALPGGHAAQLSSGSPTSSNATPTKCGSMLTVKAVELHSLEPRFV